MEAVLVCISGKTSFGEGVASFCGEELGILMYGFKLAHPVFLGEFLKHCLSFVIHRLRVIAVIVGVVK